MPPRELILAKAGELFHLRGYGAVSLDEIRSASGLSNAGFYEHFTSKEKLACAWLDRLARRMTMMQRSFLEKLGDRDRRLRKYFYSMRTWVEANGFRSCQFANTAASLSPNEADLIDAIDQYKRAQRQFFVELAKTLVEERDAQRIGTAIFLLYSGAMTEAQNLKATWPLEDALACAEDLCGIQR